MESNELPFKITPQFLIEMILRRRWIILIGLCLSLIVGIFLVITLPRVYEAKTLIIIEGQRVPQNYVQSIVTEDTAQRIATISQQILSTSNLEMIIKDFKLFNAPENESLFLEDKVANLRKRIAVDVIGDRRSTEAFTITFKGEDPGKVMQVTNGLASSFIDENLKVRESQAIGTSQFLDSELETMRKRLEQVEESIKNYRKQNMGELPEQLETNLRIMERLEQNLTDRQQQLREAKIRLADLRNQTNRNAGPIVVIGGSENAASQTGEGASLEDLKAELQALQSRYTDKHPDIIRLKSRIAELEANLKNQQDAGSAMNAAPISPQLRAQFIEAQREIQVAESEIESLKVQIGQYQRRIEETPKREQELLSLRRDYQNIQASYDSLLNRKLEAEIAVNMERKQKGEQFRVIDPARLPQRPVEPDMRLIFVMVLALGVGVGGGVSFLLEYLNTSFRNPEEIESNYGVPVLTSIPFLITKKHIILRRVNNVGSIAFTGVVGVLLVAFGLMSFIGPDVISSFIN